MPRASNRVGVELDASAASTSPSADLLKAKKVERRARAKQRAEEKRLKSAVEAEAASQHVVSSPEHHEVDSAGVSGPPASQQPVPLEDGIGASLGTSVRIPTGRDLKLEKLQTPEAEDEQLVAVDDAQEQDKTEKKKAPIVDRDEPLVDPQQLQQQNLTEAAEPVVVVHSSSLEEARAEFGTEEVINVDAYVAKLNAMEQMQIHQQLHQTQSALVPVLAESAESQQPPPHPHKKKKKKQGDTPTSSEEKKSTTTSPDVAAFRIQKALKKKFLKKTLKKCALFLRHSSKVFAEVDFAGLTQSPRSASPSSLSHPTKDAASLFHSQSAGSSERSSRLQQQQIVKDPSDPPVDGEQQSRRSSQVEVVDHNGSRTGKAPKQKRAKNCGKRERRRGSSSSSSSSASSALSEGSSRNSKSEQEGDSAPTTLSSSRSSRSSRASSSSSASVTPSSSSSSSPSSPRKIESKQSAKNKETQPSGPNKNPKKSSKEKRDSTKARHGATLSDSDTPLGPTLALLDEAVVTEHPVSEAHDADVENHLSSEEYSHSIIKIQAWLRGVEGRRRAHIRRVEFEREIESEALYEVHEEASVRIQAIMRGYLIRRQLGVVGKSPTSIRSNNIKPKKKNRRASITGFFKGEDIAESAQSQRMVTPESPERRGSAIDEEKDQESASAGRKDSGEEVAEWPTEFNLESLDEWEELNNPANVSGDFVTHAHFLSKGKLRVFCGTWNMHAKKPQDDLRLWIPLNKYHIVAVGSEECVNSIAKSVVFTSKKQWEDLLKETLGEEYVLVSSHSLTAIHNIVFVHESVIPLLSNIQSDAVATGLGNQLGNKGGVGIAFSIGRTSFAFVNCHFDAHQRNTEKRNGNFHRINQELKLYPQQNIPITSSSLPPTSNAVTGQSSLDGLGKTTATRFSMTSSANTATGPVGKKLAISECFDRVFWFGDLNYRINGTRRMVDLLLLHNKFDVLRFNDQLQIEMAKGNVFAHFQEGPLHFRPTYKFDKHSNVYDSSGKQRIPSWTDRILYLSNEKPSDIEILSYRSEMTFQTSDHRPVGATFHVGFKSCQAQFTAESNAFSRVLARGYKPNQAKSEVCAVQ